MGRSSLDSATPILRSIVPGSCRCHPFCREDEEAVDRTARGKLEPGAFYEMGIRAAAAVCQGLAWELPRTSVFRRCEICLSCGSVCYCVCDDGWVLAHAPSEYARVHARLLGRLRALAPPMRACRAPSSVQAEKVPRLVPRSRAGAASSRAGLWFGLVSTRPSFRDCP